jgi:hypothetical protein
MNRVAHVRTAGTLLTRAHQHTHTQRGGGRSVWSAWFMRFAAERGLYAIYTNFPNEQSFIVNYRDKVRA